MRNLGTNLNFNPMKNKKMDYETLRKKIIDNELEFSVIGEYPELCARLRAERKSKNIDLSNLRDKVNKGLMFEDLCYDMELMSEGRTKEEIEVIRELVTPAARARSILFFAQVVEDTELEMAILDIFEDEIYDEFGRDE